MILNLFLAGLVQKNIYLHTGLSLITVIMFVTCSTIANFNFALIEADAIMQIAISFLYSVVIMFGFNIISWSIMEES